MASVLVRTCSVSMEALADELRLFKAQIAGMQGRLDYILAEIATEIEREPVGKDEISVVDPRPTTHDYQTDDKFDAPLDSVARGAATQPPTTVDVDASLDRTHIATSFPSEPEAVMPVDVNDELILIDDIDAAPPIAAIGAVDQEESAQVDVPADAVDAYEVESSPVAQRVIPIIEASLPAEASEAGIPTEAVSVRARPDNSREPDAPVETLATSSPFPWNVVVLGALHQQAMQKSHSAIVKAGRRVAVIALATAAIAVAAVGSGFATRETLPSNTSLGPSVQEPVSSVQEMRRQRAKSAFH